MDIGQVLSKDLCKYSFLCYINFVKVKIMRDKFEKRAAKPPNAPENEMECSPIPQHLMRCIHGQLYRTCPDGIRVESQECTDLQEYLNNCHGPLEWKKGHRHPE